jgi:hypothetical protein
VSENCPLRKIFIKTATKKCFEEHRLLGRDAMLIGNLLQTFRKILLYPFSRQLGKNKLLELVTASQSEQRSALAL